MDHPALQPGDHILFLMVYSSSFEEKPVRISRKLREFVISWEAVIGLAIRACVVG